MNHREPSLLRLSGLGGVPRQANGHVHECLDKGVQCRPLVAIREELAYREKGIHRDVRMRARGVLEQKESTITR
jgi:hypothetical protein